jgi:hypothetical protein
MFDHGTGNIGVSRGDGTAGKLPCLRLANPQPKSTLVFSSDPGRHSRPVFYVGNCSLRQALHLSLLRQFSDIPGVGNGDAKLLF